MISRASDGNLTPRQCRSNRFAGSGGIDAGNETPSGESGAIVVTAGAIHAVGLEHYDYCRGDSNQEQPGPTQPRVLSARPLTEEDLLRVRRHPPH